MRFLSKNQKGQSAVEFVLIAPLLFLIFFGIIQIAYMSYVSLAVQRTALSVARTASLTGSISADAFFKPQLALNLLPSSNFNQKILLTILESQCSVNSSPNSRQVIAEVDYPMPIWVPLVQNIFGKPLVASENYNISPEGQAIREVFQFLGKEPPDLSFQGVEFPVVWIKYQATTYREAYGF